MVAGFDPLLVLPAAMLFPLAATLRQSWPGAKACTGVVSALIAGPFWLLPLIFIVPMSLGLMLDGTISPLPQVTYARLAQGHGNAVGLFAALAVIVAEFWLLLTPAMVMLRHAPPGKAAELKAVIPLNIALGGAFLAAVFYLGR
jgi:hypothetical protein